MNVSAIIGQIKRVTIELSNQCPMAPFHKQCPAHEQTEVRVLWRPIIDDIITTLARFEFDQGKRTIAFHCYNEPLADPRLFSLIEQVRAAIPTVGIRICSNGETMTSSLFSELVKAGATRIVFSAYSDERYDALRKIVKDSRGPSVRVRVHRVRKFDGRTDKWATMPMIDTPCGAPFNDLMIRSTGNVGLCCYDCDESVVFGNLYEDNFATVLSQAYCRMDTFREALRTGDRSIAAVCQHCRSKR